MDESAVRLHENTGEPLWIAVRPTRAQLALARLILLFYGREGRWSIGFLCVLIGGILGFGAAQALRLALNYGLFATLHLIAPPAFGVASTIALGACALYLYCLRAGDDLSRIEAKDGVLLQLGSRGMAATVHGATAYYDWEHVTVRGCAAGLIFLFPRRTFHLLPYEALADACTLDRLRYVLLEAKLRVAG